MPGYRAVKHIGPCSLKHLKDCKVCKIRVAEILAGCEVYKAIRLSRES